MAKFSFEDIRSGSSRPRRNTRPLRPKITTEETGLSNLPKDPVVSMPVVEEAIPPVEQPETPFVAYNKISTSEKTPRIIIWGIAGLSVVALFFTLLGLFGGATITITPKNEKTVLDGTFIAASDANDGEIPFEMLTVKHVETKEIPATDEEQREERATGQIIIYNEYSESSQRLIKNTRFETPEGLVYRVRESVVVPGMKAGAPGSVEVTVSADEPGEKYNVGLTDFTIPGFKGDPRFGSFYARSKTPMTGGFLGTVKTASPQTIKQTEDEIRSRLSETLLLKAQADKPEGFVLYTGAVFVSTGGAATVTETNGDMVRISLEGVFQAPIFNKAMLSEFIAQETIGSYDGAPVTINNIEDLSFSILDKETKTAADTSFKVKIGGNVNLSWIIDDEALKNRLVGTPKRNFPSILKEFPYIIRAEASIVPFWKQDFPKEPKNIKIVRENE